MLSNYELPPGQWSSGAEYLIRECPSCHKRDKLYWNVDKAKGWCFSCHMPIRGWKQFGVLFGPQYTVVEDLRATPDFSTLDYPSCWYQNAWDSPFARRFLISRGVTEVQARATGIYWLEEEGALACLATPLPPELIPGVVYRRLRPKESKWLSRGVALTRYGFGMEQFDSSSGVALLVEGIFDLLALDLLGRGFGIFGSHVSETWIDWLHQNRIRPVLWFDPDKGGFLGVREAENLLKAYGIPYAVFRAGGMHPKEYQAWEPEHVAIREGLLRTMDALAREPWPDQNPERVYEDPDPYRVRNSTDFGMESFA